MVKCCVPLCYNASYRKTPEIAFHRFPKDEHLRNAWIKNITRKDWQPNSSSVICSEHFKKNLLSGGAFRTVLAPGAIPTIFKEFASTAENKENEMLSLEPSSISGSSSTGNIVLHEIVEQSTSTAPETTAVPLSATAISLKPEMSTVQPGPSSGTPHLKTIEDLHVKNPLLIAPLIKVLQPSTSAMIRTSAVHLSTAIVPSRPQMQMAQSSSSNVASHAGKPECCSSARDLRKLKQTLITKNKSLKALREKARRLKKKIAKFSDVITELKGKLQDEDLTILKNIPVSNKDFLIRYIKKAQNLKLESSYSPELRSFALQLNCS